MKLKTKIAEAQILIRDFYSQNPDAFIAYSGGKDSKIILHLVKEAFPDAESFCIVHNIHPEEFCDITGTIQVKKEDFSDFLKLSKNLTAQIDGTRTCEFNKKVIFNGKLIDRISIPNKVNNKGVFDLKVLYPILDWTDDDVWEYIRYNKLMSEFEIQKYIPSRPYD